MPSAEEIKDAARWMMVTPDATFWNALMRFRVFMRGKGRAADTHAPLRIPLFSHHA